MKFSYGYILWFLFLVIPMSLAVFFVLRQRRRRIEGFATSYLFKKIAPAVVQRRAVLKPVVWIIAFAVLVFALSGPRFGSVQEITNKQASDIVIALDVSRSMLAEDVLPNRLEKAKVAISTLFKKLKGDRVAMVVFAGNAYIQLPLTTDYAAGEMFLDAVNADMIPVQGTALGAAIEKSRSCFPKDEENPTSKAIILITDGENHEDNPMEQAELAKAEGIIIYTVGMGSPKGVPLPQYNNGMMVGYKTDKSGATVISKLDEKTLTGISSATGGIYVQGNNTITALDRVMKEINSLDKKEKEGKRYTENENRYQFFVLFAIILLVAEYLISERRSLKTRVKRLFE